MGLLVSPHQGRADLGSGLSSREVGLPGLAHLGRDSPLESTGSGEQWVPSIFLCIGASLGFPEGPQGRNTEGK